MSETYIVVAGSPGDLPSSIVASQGIEGAVANADNLQALTEALRSSGIGSAFVFGWNDSPGDFVLWANGALSPYDPAVDDTTHALGVVTAEAG